MTSNNNDKYSVIVLAVTFSLQHWKGKDTALVASWADTWVENTYGQ